MIFSDIDKIAWAIEKATTPLWVTVLLAILPVVATCIIFWRQNKVIKAQLEIANQQNKIALFDKRYEIYKIMLIFWSHELNTLKLEQITSDSILLFLAIKRKDYFSIEVQNEIENYDVCKITRAELSKFVSDAYHEMYFKFHGKLGLLFSQKIENACFMAYLRVHDILKVATSNTSEENFKNILNLYRETQACLKKEGLEEMEKFLQI